MEKKITLDQCILITTKEYCELEKPEFVGQTRLDENQMYYTVWKVGETYYKVYNKV